MTSPRVNALPARVTFVNADSSAAIYPERHTIVLTLQGQDRPGQFNLTLPASARVAMHNSAGVTMRIFAWALLENDVLEHVY